MEPYRVNPPLFRMIAALPLVFDQPDYPFYTSESPYDRTAFVLARNWIESDPALWRHLVLARLTMAGFVALGVWCIGTWTRELYGEAAALLAVTMWLFSPDVVTYSSTVGPDLPASASGLLVAYVTWNWLRRRKREFPWTVSAAIAFAVLCKFTWLFLFALIPLLAIIAPCFCNPANAPDASPVNAPTCARAKHSGRGFFYLNYRRVMENLRGSLRDVLRLILSYPLAILLINLCYHFDGFGTPLGDISFISQAFGDVEFGKRQTGNRFAGTFLASFPVPLPREMIQGIDYLKYEFEGIMPSYLRGEWRTPGWWYFYLYALAVKMPLGYVAVIGAAALSSSVAMYRSRCITPAGYLLVWACAFVAFVSSQTGFTHHVRYVLPAYGFLFMVAAGALARLRGRLLVLSCLICFSGTVWFHCQHLGRSHTFFNSLAGGPNNGWRHLSFSNVDWGQSGYRMLDWVREHPETRPITVLELPLPGRSLQSTRQLEGIGTEVQFVPVGTGESATRTPTPGWYLMSSYFLTAPRFEYFRTIQPIEQPDPDIVLFFVPPSNESSSVER